MKTRGAIATVGTFDGFHRGHRDLMQRLAAEALHRDLRPLAVTFDRHPLAAVGDGSRAPALLSPRFALKEMIGRCGVGETLFLHFTPRMAAMTAEDFMRMLRRDYDIRALLMGFNNTLGSERSTSPEFYVEAGRRAGVDVIFAPQFVDSETGVTPASTLLRRLVTEGDMDAFSRYAGHPYEISGPVVHGLRNGHRLGFPTLNIAVGKSTLLPAPGVYSARVAIDGGNPLPAVVNVGSNPTVAPGRPLTVEVHVPGRDLGERYGSEAIVAFVSRIRDERRFDSFAELSDAIAADSATALRILADTHGDTAD